MPDSALSVCLLLISDGRQQYLDRTIISTRENLPGFEQMVHIRDDDHQLGFDGAIREGWRQALDTGCEYVLHLEADFTFNQPVPVDRIIGVLERNPYLAQIVLKRQAWNQGEIAAGGIVEEHPDDFTQRTEHGDIWTEHRRFFSTNPSFYPVGLCAQGWPAGANSEGRFTARLLEDPDLRFAFWGGKFDAPLVEHIGVHRAGQGY